jgi:hypothetical protein
VGSDDGRQSVLAGAIRIPLWNGVTLTLQIWLAVPYLDVCIDGIRKHEVYPVSRFVVVVTRRAAISRKPCPFGSPRKRSVLVFATELGLVTIIPTLALGTG